MADDVLAAVLDTVAAWIVRCDSRGRLIDVNQACLAATGYDRSDIVGRPVWDTVIPPDQADEVKRVLANMVTGKQPSRFINDWVAKDGSRRTVAWSNCVTTNKRGAVDAIIGTGIDITDSVKVERHLRDNERFIQALVDNALDLITVIDADGTIRFSSPSIERVLGYKLEERVGRNAFEFVHPDDAERVRQAIARGLKAGREIETAEYRYRAADGTWHWLESVGRNLIADPAVGGIVINSRDVTMRRELEQRYQAIVEQSPDAIMVIDPETTLMLAFNRAACEVHGYSAEQMRALTIADYDFGETQDDIRRRIERVLAAGTDDFETRMRRGDGEIRDVQVRLSLIEISGRPALNAIVRDITLRKRAQEALAKSELRFRDLVETTPDWVWQADENGVFTYASPQVKQLLGHEPEAVLGHTPYDFMPPEEAERVRAEVTGLTRGQGPFEHLQNVMRHKDGRLVVLETSGVPVLAPDGAFRGHRGIARDVTQSRAAMRELQRTNRLLVLIRRCNQELVRARDETALLASICRLTVEEGGYRFAYVGFVDGDPKETLRLLASYGEGGGFLDALRLPDGEDRIADDVPRRAAADSRGVPAVVRDIAANGKATPWRDAALAAGFASRASFALKVGDRVIGVLNAFSAAADVFDDDEIRLLRELADDLAFGIVSLRETGRRLQAEQRQLELERQREQALIQTIDAIALAAEARDPYTSGHEKRVARLAKAIAVEMGLPADQCEGIGLAGAIHDIGKLHVPMEILARPARLNAAEFELVKAHAPIGYNILKSIQFSWPVAEAVYQHHERWDGSGYPNGLKGEAIMLEARILGAADVIEAMASHRPYRPALGIDAALLHVLQNRGVLYDPRVVDACLVVCKESDPFFDDAAPSPMSN